MEDAHIAQCDINADGHPSDMSIFGVFDGHGGNQLSQNYNFHDLHTSSQTL